MPQSDPAPTSHGPALKRAVPQQPETRRLRAFWQSVISATVAAFSGGVAVFAVQYGLSQVSAGYPPLVQALLCGPQGEKAAATLTLAEESGAILPMVYIAAGVGLECHLEAPG